MDMNQASVFLAGSILTMLGFVVVVIGVVVINNIIHKFWKPVKLFTPDSFTLFGHQDVRFVTQEEFDRISHKIDEPIKDTNGNTTKGPK